MLRLKRKESEQFLSYTESVPGAKIDKAMRVLSDRTIIYPKTRWRCKSYYYVRDTVAVIFVFSNRGQLRQQRFENIVVGIFETIDPTIYR